MDDSNYKIIRLIERYLVGEASDEEKKELMEWVQANPKRQSFLEEFQNSEALEERTKFTAAIDSRQALRRLKKTMRIHRRYSFQNLTRYAALVALPLILSLFVWWIMDFPKEETTSPVAITPGGQRAILTLAGGTTVQLGEEEKLIENKDGVHVKNTSSGLIYTTTENTIKSTQFNCLRTPRGAEYKVTLSDGTQVYLNAGSELTYPLSFDGNTREVHFSGEAFFEVFKDEHHPFIVVTDGVRVNVRGTSFNLNTRHTRGIQTLLVTGRVEITGQDSEVKHVLYPSELAEFTRDGSFIGIRTVDTTPYLAWKEGQLVFENETLQQIMETLSMWYDVDVVFVDQEVKDHLFTGHVKKYERMDVILDAISRILGVTFTVEGKTINVTR